MIIVRVEVTYLEQVPIKNFKIKGGPVFCIVGVY